MEENIAQARRKSLLWGVIGGVSLLALYFIIVSVANSFDHAVQEFGRLWFWIAALVVGFGVQIGLYMHVRQTIRLKEEARGITSAVAAGGGLSTVSMLACCAHHLTDFLPILGLSAAAVFLTSYQVAFMWVGILSNVVGITYMLSIIARHHLYFESNRWLTRLARIDYRRVFRIEIPTLSILLVVGVFFLPQTSAELPTATDSFVGQATLEAQEVEGNGIWVIASGDYDGSARTVTFQIKFTTHSGSLDFRVDEIATLKINGQKVDLRPSWEGSPPGGHHRSGVLRYENLPEEVKSITLTLSTEGRLGTRTFEWEL
jgi:hypothetical protein